MFSKRFFLLLHNGFRQKWSQPTRIDQGSPGGSVDKRVNCTTSTEYHPHLDLAHASTRVSLSANIEGAYLIHRPHEQLSKRSSKRSRRDRTTEINTTTCEWRFGSDTLSPQVLRTKVTRVMSNFSRRGRIRPCIQQSMSTANFEALKIRNQLLCLRTTESDFIWENFGTCCHFWEAERKVKTTDWISVFVFNKTVCIKLKGRKGLKQSCGVFRVVWVQVLSSVSYLAQRLS